MSSYLEFSKFDELPKYAEPVDFTNYNEPRDLPKHEKLDEFPHYEEPPEFSESIAIMAEISDTPRSPSSPANKNLEQIIRTPGRKPSPQPTHFSVPKNGNGNGHRVLRSATVGYIAPEFKGKPAQMLQGKRLITRWEFCSDNL